jgi:hypothetical protein
MPLSLAWFGLINWKSVLLKGLPYLAAITAVLGAGWYIYHSGSKHGAAGIQSKWDKQKFEDAKAAEKLRVQVGVKETVHQQSSQRISDELSDANQEHAAAIAAIRVDYANRLRNSEQRATYYQHLSASGTTQQEYLASHAAELDRSLEEGRQLVQELSATVRQRDAQVIALGQQILTDRALVGEKDGQSSASTK